jgi:integrase
MIDGERISVTCETLGLSVDLWTQEGSRDAAWAFKLKLQGEIAKKREAEHPHAERIKELVGRFQVSQDLGIDPAPIQRQIEAVQQLDADQTGYLDAEALSKVQAAKLLGIDLSGVDPIALNALFGSEQLWSDRQRRSKRVEIGKMIGDASKRFIEGKQDEARTGVRSSDGADNIRRWLTKFVVFAGELTAIDQISFEVWERWQRSCLAKSRQTQTEEAAKEYQVSKTFVRWLWKQELLTPPRNLDDRLKFPRWTKAIVTYSNANVKKTVRLATGQLKLHLLLMLNCGMTQKDISDLRKDQINIKAGTISRKRSKTELQANTPLVTYHLWPSTLAELKRHLSSHDTLALTTKSGQAWCRKETTESGKIRKADNVATLWKNLKDANPKATYLTTLKAFKKSSATLLRNEATYSQYYNFFLGHSERGVANVSYAALKPETFKSACHWLGKQFGIAEKSEIE